MRNGRLLPDGSPGTAAVPTTSSRARGATPCASTCLEGLLAQTASDNAIPHRSIAEVRRSGRPLLDRLNQLDRAVDAQTTAAGGHARARRARAWRLTALTGALAFAILTILLVGLVRTRRAARRAIAAAARAEGERGALQASSRRFHALVRHASEAVIVLDEDGAVTFATPSVDGLLGRAELGGELLSGLVAPEDVGRLDALILAARERGEAVAGELALIHREGRLVHAEVRVADRLSDPDVNGVVLAVRDVSERRRLERQLRDQRPLWTRSPGCRTARASRTGCARCWSTPSRAAPCSLLDLDEFETVNESLGHTGGDQVLVTCADRLRAAAGNAAVARLGSDEFVVLLEGVAAAEHAERFAARARRRRSRCR